MTPTVDWLDAADLPAFQALVAAHWKPGHVLAADGDLVRWQYRDARHPERLSILGAWEDDALAAVLGLVQTDFTLAGDRAPGAWLAFWLATPEARTRRTGLALLLEALRGPWRTLACLGMNDQAARIFGGLGFELVPRLPRWVRPLDPDALAALAPGGPRPRPRPARSAAPRPLAGGFDGDLADRWDDAWGHVYAPRLAGTWRDAAYLRSRYVEHPWFDYEVRTDGRALLVYRVERIRGRDEQVVRVLECLGDAGGLAAAMLDAHADAAFADFHCTDPAAGAALESAGFVREELLAAPLPDRFQPLEAAPAGINGAFRLPTVAATLYATKSDGDQDRPNG